MRKVLSLENDIKDMKSNSECNEEPFMNHQKAEEKPVWETENTVSSPVKSEKKLIQPNIKNVEMWLYV